ncbi:methionyl-tRNA formyltransferase [Kangiella sp. TOML190]|uniref:methionyl-tRNA formyltransferase n=1 Tax=Kangiella sp. TOML190 TaxID=2931351 RepID=UPI00203DB76C|nr:methionyl-tRNA formyltransferase [Kangiella sp. TOML190]
MKIIFAGTPDFAASSLQALITHCHNTEHQVVAVYTQPDRKAGRGKKTSMSPVKALALAHDIAVEQPVNFKDQNDRENLAQYHADLMVVVAYGLLLPQAVLDTPKLGCINVHGSLLPRWRGAAPIQRAIEVGDTQSGITIMQMDAGLDTGPMLLKAVIPIADSETGSSLHDKLAAQGANLLVKAIDKLANEQISAEIQDDQLATYAHKLSKQEAQIDWQDSATHIERKIRAFNSWPICTAQIEGQIIRVWQAEVVDSITDEAAGTILRADKEGILVACNEALLRLTHLQMAGSKMMAVKDLLNAPARQALFAEGKQFELISS